MMELVKDELFVQVDSVPDCVCQPLHSRPMFVVSHDVDGLLDSASLQDNPHWQSHHTGHTCTDLTSIAYTCSSVANNVPPPPPPLPPKPSHLCPSTPRQHPGGPTQQETASDNSMPNCDEPASLTQMPIAELPCDTLPVDEKMPLDFLPLTDNDQPHLTSSYDSNSLICEENAEEVKTMADDNTDDNDDAALMNGEMAIVRPVSRTPGDGHVPETVSTLAAEPLTDSGDAVTRCSQLLTSSSSSSSLMSSCSDKARTLTSTAVNRDQPRRLSAPASQQHHVVDSRHSAFDSQHCVINSRHSAVEPQRCVINSANSSVDHLSHCLQHSMVIDAAINNSIEECRTPRQVSDIEKQYSLVRKKKDQRPRLAVSRETASVRSEEACVTETVNTQQPSADVCPPSSLMSGVQAPSSLVASVEALSASLRWSVSHHQDLPRFTSSTASREWTLHGGTDVERHVRKLSQGSLLLVQQSPAIAFDSPPLTDSDGDHFAGTLMAYDSHGSVFYVPVDDLKVHGDPDVEAWFFPVPLTPLQATILLSSRQVEGSFLVYREGASNLEYSLAVCHGTDVLHYAIARNASGDLSVSGHQHSFLTVSDLVAYFQHNRSGLVTRLGRPMSTARLPVTPGRDFDARFELARSQITVTGNIIANGRFGVICAGEYRHQPVAIKVPLDAAVTCHNSLFSLLHPGL